MAQEEERKSGSKALLSGLGIVGLAVLKWKAALFGLLKGVSILKMGWLLKSFASMGLFFSVYWFRFGWAFAAGLVGLIFAHEMGHFIYMKSKGLNPKLPIFIPFLGAYVAMDNAPKDKATNAWSAFAGPFVGGLISAIVYAIGVTSGSDLMVGLGNFGFMLNLFQLIPIKPLDGGFIADSLSKWLFVPGVVLALGAAVVMKSFLLLIISAFGIFAMIRAFMKQPSENDLTEASMPEKIRIGLSYFAVTIALGICYWSSSALVIH